MRLIVTMLIALASIQAMADADLQAGKAAYAVCASCHGPQAQGNEALKAPRLDHLSSVYLAAQLQKFKSGARGGQGATPESMQMAGMAAALADQQAIENVSAYIASIEGAANKTTVAGDATLGGDYYNQFCGACHGAAAEGNPALNSPALAGTDDWYLLAQLEAFKSGARGSHPEDRTGKQMQAMSRVLPSEQAMRDVVAFIGTLGR
jgi:cytochrome c553